MFWKVTDNPGIYEYKMLLFNCRKFQTIGFDCLCFQKVSDNPEEYECKCYCLWGHCGDDPDGDDTKYTAVVSTDTGVSRQVSL